MLFKFRFPTPPPPSTTSPPARIAVFCSGFLTTPPPIQTLYLVIIDYMRTGNGGGEGGGVGNLREKDRNVVMLLFLFFSGLRWT